MTEFETQEARQKVPTSKMAIASLVLGILGLIACPVAPLFGIPALILAILALRKTSTGQAKGKGLAITGLVLSLISFVIFLIVLAGVMLPAINSARHIARQAKCINNLKMISVSMFTYAERNNNELPPSGVAGLELLRKGNHVSDLSVFVCPGSNEKAALPNQPITEENLSYVYVNPGNKFNKINNPSTTPILWDKQPGNHLVLDCVLYLDGHVATLSPEEREKLDKLAKSAK